jgi:hypothetical protein
VKYVNCTRCDKNRPHHAHGLCPDCYHATRGRHAPKGFCRDAACPSRGYLVPIIARGLCFPCYNRNRRAGTISNYPTQREQRERQHALIA